MFLAVPLRRKGGNLFNPKYTEEPRSGRRRTLTANKPFRGGGGGGGTDLLGSPLLLRGASYRFVSPNKSSSLTVFLSTPKCRCECADGFMGEHNSFIARLSRHSYPERKKRNSRRNSPRLQSAFSNPRRPIERMSYSLNDITLVGIKRN